MASPVVTMQPLIEAGAHFGHQTHRWNPRMKPYIFGERNGIHILDLSQTVPLFARAGFRVADSVAWRQRAVRRNQESGDGPNCRGCTQIWPALFQPSLVVRTAPQLDNHLD